jgi:hypothetical protein
MTVGEVVEYRTSEMTSTAVIRNADGSTRPSSVTLTFVQFRPEKKKCLPVLTAEQPKESSR